MRSPPSERPPETASVPSPTATRTTRRKLLAGLGTGALAATAGCGGSVPGLGATPLPTTVIEETNRRIAWGFPPETDDRTRVGYVAVERRREVEFGGGSSAVKFRLNASVDLDNDYELDSYRVRIRFPMDYRRSHPNTEIYVGSPNGGGWTEFRTYVDAEGNDRAHVIDHDEVGTEGTILTPFVVPGVDPRPSALRIEFTARLSKPGWFGRTATAADDGRLVFAPDA